MKEDDTREVFGSNVCSVNMPAGLHGRFRETSLWNMEINLFIQRTLSQHKSRVNAKKTDKRRMACCFCLSFCACVPGVKGYEPI